MFTFRNRKPRIKEDTALLCCFVITGFGFENNPQNKKSLNLGEICLLNPFLSFVVTSSRHLNHYIPRCNSFGTVKGNLVFYSKPNY